MRLAGGGVLDGAAASLWRWVIFLYLSFSRSSVNASNIPGGLWIWPGISDCPVGLEQLNPPYRLLLLPLVHRLPLPFPFPHTP
jgi:hypothetical protein